MPLAPGTRFGQYEVVAYVDAGGMGEVYRARDTVLGREVALKVPPEAVWADADRAARFEREARVLASLNHPNIATIHGLERLTGSADSVRCIVLELVEGPTLADRLLRGPMSVEAALGIARQLVDALESAHDCRRRASRFEAGEHQAAARRHAEGARFRYREGARRRARLDALGACGNRDARGLRGSAPLRT